MILTLRRNQHLRIRPHHRSPRRNDFNFRRLPHIPPIAMHLPRCAAIPRTDADTPTAPTAAPADPANTHTQTPPATRSTDTDRHPWTRAYLDCRASEGSWRRPLAGWISVAFWGSLSGLSSGCSAGVPACILRGFISGIAGGDACATSGYTDRHGRTRTTPRLGCGADFQPAPAIPTSWPDGPQQESPGHWKCAASWGLLRGRWLWCALPAYTWNLYIPAQRATTGKPRATPWETSTAPTQRPERAKLLISPNRSNPRNQSIQHPNLQKSHVTNLPHK